MKWVIIICMIILCSAPVLGDKELVDKVLNFESEDNNGVCEGIENPLLNSIDCQWGDFLNSDWFIKLIILGIIIFIINNPKFLQDKTAGILIAVFVLILLFPIDNFINQKTDIPLNESIVPENNQTLIQGKIVNVTSHTTPIFVLEKSPLEEVIDWILLIPKRLWPTHPRFALIIVIVVGFIFYNELGRKADKIRYRI